MPEDTESTQSLASNPVLPYLECTSDDYARVAAASMTELPITGGVALRGSCPRCGCAMEFLWIDDHHRGILGSLRHRPPMVHNIPMVCTCCPQVPHPDTPIGVDGCGAYWDLEWSPNPPNSKG